VADAAKAERFRFCPLCAAAFAQVIVEWDIIAARQKGHSKACRDDLVLLNAALHGLPHRRRGVNVS